MKKIILVASALLMSTAATAQMPHRDWDRGHAWAGARDWDGNAFWRGAPEGPRERIQFLQERVNRGVANGSLNRREAYRVTQELNGVRTWIRRMHWRDAGPLNPAQGAQVQAKLDQISRQIHWLSHNGW